MASSSVSTTFCWKCADPRRTMTHQFAFLIDFECKLLFVCSFINTVIKFFDLKRRTEKTTFWAFGLTADQRCRHPQEIVNVNSCARCTIWGHLFLGEVHNCQDKRDPPQGERCLLPWQNSNLAGTMKPWNENAL